MPHPLVYEINTRCWLQQLSCRIGRSVSLANVPDSEFQYWTRLGFTHLWLMGVWATGPRGRAVALAVGDLQKTYGHLGLQNLQHIDIAGSPYAVARYQVSESLGGTDGLQRFRRRLYEHGLKLLLDFVPNHLGLDHPWLTERPELFVQSPQETPGTFSQETRQGCRWIAHGRDPNFPPWVDTAQLDYRQHETREAMQTQLLEVAGQCDGVRCDMAMLELNDVFARTWAQFPSRLPDGIVSENRQEFWQQAIAATRRSYPGFLFLAEAYWGLESRLQSLGFDYTYDKELYDEIVRRHPAGVQRRLLSATPEFIGASAHFLENHDEERIASLLAPEEHRAAAWLILSLPGMRLLHEGQLDGARIKIPVQFSRRCFEDEQPEIRVMYYQLLKRLKESAVGWGKGVLLAPFAAGPEDPTFQNFVVVQWQKEPGTFDLAAVNLSAGHSECHVRLVIEKLAGHTWGIQDGFGQETVEVPGIRLQDEGFKLGLPSHGVGLFQFRSIRQGTLKVPKVDSISSSASNIRSSFRRG